MEDTTRDNAGRAEIVNRIRQLERDIFEVEKERSHLASRAGTEGPVCDSMKGLTDAEDHLRALRSERRLLEDQLDNLRQSDLIAQKALHDKRVNDLESQIRSLTQEKERLSAREIPDARRKLDDLETRLRQIEQESRDLIRAVNQLRHSRK